MVFTQSSPAVVCPSTVGFEVGKCSPYFVTLHRAVILRYVPSLILHHAVISLRVLFLPVRDFRKERMKIHETHVRKCFLLSFHKFNCNTPYKLVLWSHD